MHCPNRELYSIHYEKLGLKLNVRDGGKLIKITITNKGKTKCRIYFNGKYNPN